MDKAKMFCISSLLSPKKGLQPLKRQLSGKALNTNSRQKPAKEKIHIEKLRLEISDYLLKKYVKDTNSIPHPKKRYFQSKSMERQKNQFSRIESLAKQRNSQEGLQIENKILLPLMRDIRSRSQKKAKTNMGKNSVDGLSQGDIISGAKKVIDNKEYRVRVQEKKEIRRRKPRARINGTRVYDGRLGPWNNQEEVILDLC